MKKKSKRSVKNPGHTSDADKPVSAGVPAGTALKFIDEWGPRVRNWWPAIGVACTLAWVLIVWLWHVALSFPEAFVQVALAAVAFTTPVWLLYVIDTSELLNTEPVQRRRKCRRFNTTYSEVLFDRRCLSLCKFVDRDCWDIVCSCKVFRHWQRY